jgi:hypothetical protein
VIQQRVLESIGESSVPYQIDEPIDIPHIQQVLEGLDAEIRERVQAAANLALQNAELHNELQRRLSESESLAGC